MSGLVEPLIDSERLRYLVANPRSGSHLLVLLALGKATEGEFYRMLDSLIASAKAETTP